jgi:hypothetical protein
MGHYINSIFIICKLLAFYIFNYISAVSAHENREFFPECAMEKEFAMS